MNLKIHVHGQLRFIATMDQLSLGKIFRGYLYLGCYLYQYYIKIGITYLKRNVHQDKI